VTPRIGKPVEIQALWLNALRIGSGFSERWAELYARGRAAFEARFWNEARGALHDVVDVDHRPGTVDPTFAVGGLPFAVLEGERARRVVDTVEARLLTPLGLRSLAADEPGYTPRYAGGVRERDGAYTRRCVSIGPCSPPARPPALLRSFRHGPRAGLVQRMTIP